MEGGLQKASVSRREKAPVSSRATEPYYPKLPDLESAVYWVIYVGIYGYSVSLVYGISLENEAEYFEEGNLEPGWKILGGKLQDTSDTQWSLMMRFFWDVYVVGFAGHFITARLAEGFWPSARYKFLCAYGVAYTAYFFGIHGLLLMLSHFVIQYLAARLTKNVIVCWITGLLLCYSLLDSVSSEGSNLEFAFTKLVRPFQKDEDKADFLMFATAMCSLRYIAFSLEYVWAHQEATKRREGGNGADEDVELTAKKKVERQSRNTTVTRRQGEDKEGDIKSERKTVQRTVLPISKFSFLDLLVYQFYFPLMYGGPVMTYEKFAKEIEKEPAVWTLGKLGKFTFGLIRFAFWIAFVEFTLHYNYLSSLADDAETLQKMTNFFPLIGIACAQVGFFYLKHVVGYGLPSHFSSSDYMEAPKGPHCPYSKHLLTDMWKTFDRGLHKWLIRYIYHPLGGTRTKIYFIPIVTFLPFLFTAFWHGGDEEYLYWALLSWIGVFTEGLFFKLYKTAKVRDFETSYLTPAWSRRIRALFSTISFQCILTIDVYFQSGMEVGNVYWHKFYHESALITFLFSIFYYTATQSSMDLNRWGVTTE